MAMQDPDESAKAPAVRPEQRPHVVDPEEGPVKPFPINISGEVVKGFGRGSKELGIPTANLAESAIPDLLEHAESGIYYGLATVEGDDEVRDMVMSVGWNPYYKNTVRSAEVHVVHKFHNDFYGKQLRIIVIGFIRPEYNYASLESLVDDINEDIAVAKRSLARPGYQKGLCGCQCVLGAATYHIVNGVIEGSYHEAVPADSFLLTTIMSDSASALDYDGSGHFRRIDENIASLFFGWCLALLVLTSYRIAASFLSCSTQKCTKHLCLSTLLILANTALAILAWTYQLNSYRPGFADFAAFIALWSLEAQVYFQLIINRICILDLTRKHANLLRFGVLFVILLINISMFAIWLPSKLHQTTSTIVFWWPRVEKLFFLFIDVGLNLIFIRQVQTKLLRIGLVKYRRLISYNMWIISLSILCDVLLLGMQWYPRNDSLYILVHPVIYFNKLIFEMSICEKMAAVSRESNDLNVLRLKSPFKARPKRESSASSSMEFLYNSAKGSDMEIRICEKLLPETPSAKIHVRGISDF